jgi:hypothetical protein
MINRYVILMFEVYMFLNILPVSPSGTGVSHSARTFQRAALLPSRQLTSKLRVAFNSHRINNGSFKKCFLPWYMVAPGYDDLSATLRAL